MHASDWRPEPQGHNTKLFYSLHPQPRKERFHQARGRRRDETGPSLRVHEKRVAERIAGVVVLFHRGFRLDLVRLPLRYAHLSSLLDLRDAGSNLAAGTLHGARLLLNAGRVRTRKGDSIRSPHVDTDRARLRTIVRRSLARYRGGSFTLGDSGGARGMLFFTGGMFGGSHLRLSGARKSLRKHALRAVQKDASLSAVLFAVTNSLRNQALTPRR